MPADCDPAALHCLSHYLGGRWGWVGVHVDEKPLHLVGYTEAESVGEPHRNGHCLGDVSGLDCVNSYIVAGGDFNQRRAPSPEAKIEGAA